MLRRASGLFFTTTVVVDLLGASFGWCGVYALLSALGFVAEGEAGSEQGWPETIRLLPVVVACNLLALGGVGLYRPARTRYLMRECMRATKAAFLAWVGLLAVFFLASIRSYSVAYMVCYWVGNTVALVCARLLLQAILRTFARAGLGLRRAAIVGVGELGRRTSARLRSNPWVGLKVEYFVELNCPGDSQNTPERFHGVPVAYRGPDFVRYLQDHPVDVVLVAVPTRQADRLDAVIRALSRVPVSVAVMPDFTGALRISASAGEFEGLPIVELWDSPIYGWYAVAKRLVDVVVSIAGVLLFGWLMGLVALLVKLSSPGPVIFRQKRMGLGGQPFTMLKFRTMYVTAQEKSDKEWVAPSEARITPVGRFLRRTGLDELPQFFNVLRGDMSLVGPRPERPYFVEKFTEQLPAYMLRHSVKAGMTGWAQVNGLRGDTSIERRLQYDLYYINNWSLQFDLFILLVTPFAGLVARHDH